MTHIGILWWWAHLTLTVLLGLVVDVIILEVVVLVIAEESVLDVPAIILSPLMRLMVVVPPSS